jgi:hypothetical protein
MEQQPPHKQRLVPGVLSWPGVGGHRRDPQLSGGGARGPHSRGMGAPGILSKDVRGPRSPLIWEGVGASLNCVGGGRGPQLGGKGSNSPEMGGRGVGEESKGSWGPGHLRGSKLGAKGPRVPQLREEPTGISRFSPGGGGGSRFPESGGGLCRKFSGRVILQWDPRRGCGCWRGQCLSGSSKSNFIIRCCC